MALDRRRSSRRPRLQSQQQRRQTSRRTSPATKVDLYVSTHVSACSNHRCRFATCVKRRRNWRRVHGCGAGRHGPAGRLEERQCSAIAARRQLPRPGSRTCCRRCASGRQQGEALQLSGLIATIDLQAHSTSQSTAESYDRSLACFFVFLLTAIQVPSGPPPVLSMGDDDIFWVNQLQVGDWVHHNNQSAARGINLKEGSFKYPYSCQTLSVI